ncbi:MAG: hypothetical protein KatS3mg068_0460 [Candidatus Sericytochromatia bacterium]|nr:MAG: hypothetical protein KatS3mg068_0460 [Candidatus Sericytochromatia bacterium]
MLKEYQYDLFISYNDSDILLVEKLYKKLVSLNIKVFFENNDYKKYYNIWEYFYKILENSKYNLIIYSENVIKNNDKLLVIYKIWTELLGKKNKTIALNITQKRISPLFKSFYIIENPYNDIDDIIEEIKYILQSSLTTKTKKTKMSLKKINESLFYKLKFDFFIAYQYYQNIIYERNVYDEHIKLTVDNRNQHYYLDYWGLKIAKILAPLLFDDFYSKTSNYLHSKLSKNRILEIPVQKIGKEIKTIKSIKQTIWSLEILLLSEKNLDFIIEFTQEFLLNKELYICNDNGWKDFINKDSNSSLLSSLYVFCFLSKIKKYLDLEEELLLKTENFIINEWNTKKGIFSNLHWIISSINILIIYLPFSSKIDKIQGIINEVLDIFCKDFFKSKKSYLGLDYYIEPYILYIRLFYIITLLKKDIYLPISINEILENIISKYTNKYYISNFDIYILTNIIMSKYNKN